MPWPAERQRALARLRLPNPPPDEESFGLWISRAIEELRVEASGRALSYREDALEALGASVSAAEVERLGRHYRNGARDVLLATLAEDASALRDAIRVSLDRLERQASDPAVSARLAARAADFGAELERVLEDATRSGRRLADEIEDIERWNRRYLQQEPPPIPGKPPDVFLNWKGEEEIQLGGKKIKVTVEKNGDTVTLTVRKPKPDASAPDPVPRVLKLPKTQSKTIDKTTLTWYDAKMEEDDLLGDGRMHSRYWKVFDIATTGDCTEWAFVQLREHKEFSWRFPTPLDPAGSWAPFPSPGWQIDGGGGDPAPSYGNIPGTSAMIDSPGSAVDKVQEGKKGAANKDETTLRTWVVCIKPKRSLLGYLEWGETVVTEMTSETSAKTTITPTSPTWHDPDKESVEQFDKLVDPQKYPNFPK